MRFKLTSDAKKYLDVLYVEKIAESNLTDEELASVIAGYKEYQNNECVDFDEYLSSCIKK